jgi:threonine/homoserine/homoserine lactone efflux protein
MSLGLLASVLVFGFVTSITPGPNNTFLFTSGANFGVRRSLPYANGIIAGLSVMMLAIAAGLGIIFATIPAIYQSLKWAGFAYVTYLAYQIAISSGKAELSQARVIGFARSVAFQFINPKAWIIMSAFMATFIHLDAPPLETLTLCVLFLAVTWPGGVIWAAGGQVLSKWLNNQSRRQVFNISAAVLLVASMIPVLLIH